MSRAQRRVWMGAFWLSFALNVGVSAARAEPSAAAVALYEGRVEDALTLSPQPDASPEAAYLAARALAALGRFAEADARLPQVPQHWPATIREDIRILRVRWTAEAGKACTLSETDASVLGKQKTLVLARCAYAAENLPRAAELLANEQGFEARALLVRVLHKSGKPDEARALLRKLYLEEPEHGEVSELLTLLAQTETTLALTVEDKLSRADKLTRAVQPERAIRELEELGKQADKSVEVRRLHLLGDAQFKTRDNYADAAKTFARAAKMTSSTQVYDAFHAVRSVARAGDNAAAIKGFIAFGKRYPKDELATDAAYLAAWLSLREHRKNAVSLLTKFVASDGAKRQRGLLRSGTWDLAWAHFSEKRSKDAQNWFSRYADIADSDLERARGHYWAGRAAQLAKQTSAAEAAYGRAVSADGLGYYALLANHALGAAGRPTPPAFPNEARAPAEPNPKPPAEVRFYAELLLTDDAVRAAEPWLKSLSNARERARGALYTADADRGFTQAAPLMDDAVREGPRASAWLWSALFPRPYTQIVGDATQRFGLPSALFYGHMQVESRYRPAVVSGADAIGLMQLLPRTAETVGEPLGIRVTRVSLTRPAVNIVLGASYLGGLVTRYGGQEPLAIAAYNAGTERVDEWIRRTGKVELARWVEEIPVEQTRNYVRRVITAWSRYRAQELVDDPWGLTLPLELTPPPRPKKTKAARAKS